MKLDIHGIRTPWNGGFTASSGLGVALSWVGGPAREPDVQGLSAGVAGASVGHGPVAAVNGGGIGSAEGCLATWPTSRAPLRGREMARTTSLWIVTRGFQGVTIHDHSGRMEGHLSSHTSPAGHRR